jgi:hypothetical protein
MLNVAFPRPCNPERAMAVHTTAVIETVRQSLIEGATFGEIGSRLGFTRATVNGIVSRNGMVGLSQHIAKIEPVEAKPDRVSKFWIGNPHTKPGNQLRNLKTESSPRAVSWNDFEPDCMCH